MQQEDSFRPHVKQQVEYAKVAQETRFGSKHLIIRSCRKQRVGKRVFWNYYVSIVNHLGRQIFMFGVLVSESYSWTHIEQLAYGVANFNVEVKQKVISAFKEGAQVVGIVLEERRFAVCALQGVPMQLMPTSMVTYAQVTYGTSVEVFVGRTFYRHREHLLPIGSGYYAAIAIGLLAIVFMSLYQCRIGHVELLVPLYGTKICSGKEIHICISICHSGSRHQRFVAKPE